MNVIRAVAAAQAITGAVLAVQPHRVTSLVGIHSPDAPPAWIVRLLGARMVGQGGVELVHPTHDVVRAGAAVDALHALSMLPVLLASPRYRRGAAVSAAIACVSAAVLATAHVAS